MPPTFQRGGPSRGKGTAAPIVSGRMGGKGKGLIAPRRHQYVSLELNGGPSTDIPSSRVSKDALKGISKYYLEAPSMVILVQESAD